MSIPILETRDLRREFSVRPGMFSAKQRLHAVNGVSLRIERGEILGLVGESGCGKTTLARMLMGLDRPTSGAIDIDGEPLAGLDRVAVARRVQPVFQDPYSSLNPRKSVGSIVSLPLRVHKLGGPDQRRRRALEVMELVGLSSHLYDSFPGQLSGGQCQRVAIARALVMQPEILICDEPTSALDVSVQAQILNQLIDLHDEFDLTLIIISHDLSVVAHMANRVAVLYLGRVVEQAETRALFENPQHPYTKALLGSVLTPDPQLGLPDTDLKGSFPSPLDPPSGCTYHPRCSAVMPECSRKAPKPNLRGGHLTECHLYDDPDAPAGPQSRT